MIEAGSAAVIHVTLKNKSKAPLTIGVSIPEAVLGVSVTDEHGQQPPGTAFARRWPRYPLAGSSPGVHLGPAGSPSGSYSMRLILTKRVDLTVPGQYTVVVWLKFAPEIRSKPLRLAVEF